MIVCIIVDPHRFINVALNGISAWSFNVLPSILPFMILTKMLSDLGPMEKFCSLFSKPIQKFYGTSPLASYTFFMSVLSGYPVGSKMIADLYESGKISKTDAFRMSSFCSNSGPMFIVGSVGVMMLLSVSAGYIILVSHILSALLNGFIYRNIKCTEENKQERILNKKEFNFGDIIYSSTSAILNVGAIIVLFFLIIECFSPILNLFSPTIASFLKGLIEITKGCLDVSKLIINQNLKTIICSFLISFGGFSTIFQSIALLKKVKMKVSLFTLQKFTHAILSAIITCLLCLI